jgi:hypothetical protein
VDAIKKAKHLSFSFLLVFSYIQNALAEMMEKGKTKVTTVYNIYQQFGSSGKQVFDESGNENLNVMEPMIFIDHQITEDTVLTAHFVYDFWTSASDEILDGATTASGGGGGSEKQSRTAGNIGFSQEHDKWTYGGNLGFSTEFDYNSSSVSVNIARSFAQDNFTLGISHQSYKDEVSLYDDFSPAEDANLVSGLARNIEATTISASQILTRKDIIQFAYTHATSSGNLESTHNSVLVDGTREVEKLPGLRDRHAYSTNFVHAFSDSTAMNLSYRYYFDDWGMKANSTRLAYLFEVNDDEDFVEIFVRQHSQTRVDYFNTSFTSREENRTSDSDLDTFTSYETGLYHTTSFGESDFLGFNFDNVDWANGFTVGSRSNGLNFGYIQTSFTVEF